MFIFNDFICAYFVSYCEGGAKFSNREYIFMSLLSPSVTMFPLLWAVLPYVYCPPPHFICNTIGSMLNLLDILYYFLIIISGMILFLFLCSLRSKLVTRNRITANDCRNQATPEWLSHYRASTVSLVGNSALGILLLHCLLLLEDTLLFLFVQVIIFNQEQMCVLPLVVCL